MKIRHRMRAKAYRLPRLTSPKFWGSDGACDTAKPTPEPEPDIGFCSEVHVRTLAEAAQHRQMMRDRQRLREIEQRQAAEDAALAARFPADTGRMSGSSAHMTLDEIAEHFGFSRERARQIETAALKKLRAYCDDYPEIRAWLEEKIGRHDCPVEWSGCDVSSADQAAFRAAGPKGHFQESGIYI